MSVNVYKGTSSNVYEVGLEVYMQDNDSDHEYCTVTLQPKLRYVGANSTNKRAQHTWHVYFTVDGVHLGTYDYTGPSTNKHNYLPNDEAEYGVVGDGKLIMQKNVWYKWGYSWGYSIKNDGKQHSVGVIMRCDNTQPWDCPARLPSGAEQYLTHTFTTANYAVIPPAPVGVDYDYNEDTRVIEYKWSGADCAYVTVWSNWFDSSGALRKGDYIRIQAPGDASPRHTLYNSDVTAHLVKETLPDYVTFVTWRVDNYSVTGHATNGQHQETTIDSDSKVYVQGKKTIPWVKTESGWKKANKTYVKVGNTFKRTII